MTDRPLWPVGRVEATSTALALPAGLPIEDWLDVGRALDRLRGGFKWWVGDWLLYGEATYDERYSQGMSATGWDYQTVANAIWVARRFAWAEREPELSWSHHAVLAGLEDAEERVGWLKQALAKRWTVAELRDEVSAAHPPDGVGARVPAALALFRREQIGVQQAWAAVLLRRFPGIPASGAVAAAEELFTVTERTLFPSVGKSA